MRGKAHLTCGIGTAIVTSGILLYAEKIGIAEAGIFGLSCMVNSVIPDIDIPESMVGKRVKPIANAINKIFGHRTITHSGLWIILWLALMWQLQGTIWWTLCYGMLMGFLSHIVSDTFTIGGVPWLWPLSRKKIRLTPIKTGEKDYIFVVLTTIILSCATAFVFLSSNVPEPISLFFTG